jgi:putative IMPACT (imprinted ancient) family translation regulator
VKGSRIARSCELGMPGAESPEPGARGILPDVRVERPAEFSLTVERSRFYALLTPVDSPDAIDALLKARSRDFRRANHHCWACRVRDMAGAAIERSKDDGEVGHPGRVLLELLRKHDLEGALVVSRIFGGVKLGVGGVSRAFRDAGQGAINAAARRPPTGRR